MRWEKGRRDGNIEDRRGMGGTVAGGGIGVAVIALIAYYVFGVDPQTAQQVASQIGGTTSSSQGEAEVGTPEDRAGQFVDVVGTNVNDPVFEHVYLQMGHVPSLSSNVPQEEERMQRIDDISAVCQVRKIYLSMCR